MGLVKAIFSTRPKKQPSVDAGAASLVGAAAAGEDERGSDGATSLGQGSGGALERHGGEGEEECVLLGAREQQASFVAEFTGSGADGIRSLVEGLKLKNDPARANGGPVQAQESELKVTPTMEGSFIIDESKSMRPPSRVVVLLDGDADFFKISFLGSKDGGRNAAIELHKRVRTWVAEKEGPGSPAPRIFASMFWNQAGLRQYLSRDDKFGGELQPFVRSFNSSPFSMSILDTGSASQSADEVLKNHLEFHIYADDYLLLGGTHDGGYSDTLHRLEERLKRKVYLLRTTPCLAQRLVDLKLPEVRFADLFDGRDPRRNFRNLAAATTTATANSAVSQEAWTSEVAFPAVSNGRITAPLATTATPSPSSQVPLKFQPLVALLIDLRKKGRTKPLRSAVGGTLRTSNPGLYSSFGGYAMEAEQLGIVSLGTGGTLGSEWIELKTNNVRTAPLAINPSISPAFVLPPAFVPLVNILRAHLATELPRPLCSKVGEQLKQGYPRIYKESGLEGLEAYSTRARDLGIVELGGPAAGAEWIALTERFRRW